MGSSLLFYYFCFVFIFMVFNMTPTYLLDEQKLIDNLQTIAGIQQQAHVQFILAFKAFAWWKTLPLFRPYIQATTASSLFEARMGYEKFGAPVHAYCPAYTEQEIAQIAAISSHLTFNSLSQYQRLAFLAVEANPDISFGLRINPEYSEVETLIYNPCAPGTRFGVTADRMPDSLPEGIHGLHCHCHCESSAEEFARTLTHIERKFHHWLMQAKWINFGGGHLVTRKGYNIPLLISTLTDFQKRYPHLSIILEPGSAFTWQTGELLAEVVDIVTDHDIRTAILNVSFTCHMPDCLEMPYMPEVRGAQIVEADSKGEHIYRLGGNSCLSGDYLGSWQFTHELSIGEQIVFEDMIHYTTVKTNMFNGVGHPDLAIRHLNGQIEVLRHFSYEDYLARMD